ncbi:hypothetical protein PTI98_000373 [Pleurotus ostreatus]|nr:hypothetical protein PTI98_000373 [Pleurotus ostreatus]
MNRHLPPGLSSRLRPTPSPVHKRRGRDPGKQKVRRQTSRLMINYLRRLHHARLFIQTQPFCRFRRPFNKSIPGSIIASVVLVGDRQHGFKTIELSVASV